MGIWEYYTKIDLCLNESKFDTGEMRAILYDGPGDRSPILYQSSFYQSSSNESSFHSSTYVVHVVICSNLPLLSKKYIGRYHQLFTFLHTLQETLYFIICHFVINMMKFSLPFQTKYVEFQGPHMFTVCTRWPHKRTTIESKYSRMIYDGAIGAGCQYGGLVVSNLKNGVPTFSTSFCTPGPLNAVKPRNISEIHYSASAYDELFTWICFMLYLPMCPL